MASCFHEQPGEIRKFKKGGVVYFGLQCPDCFRLMGRRLPPTELEDAEGRIHPGDVPWAEKKKSFAGGGNSKKKAYKAYLRTAVWKAKRSLRLEIDNYECTGCQEIATEVDHVDYARFGGQELMSDLQSVCKECHEALTQIRIGS